MKLEALLLLLMATAVVVERTCLKKYFDQDNFVCVCNDDHCDFYDTLGPIPEGEAYLVTSDRVFSKKLNFVITHRTGNVVSSVKT